ncbi:type 1 glutamine amidotransferase domain-containing protein [Oleiagrimonas sp. C23AA]|uniref:type 1 glutamine amidotransferase domain-containing protein n=1 Tax=Oleiagrimonas sp. C23AA TaxID=2719047 RepID=UPI0014234776|nr:type 1 glutamine amidotransferase domain-containing protein [Oleiagrimonas sp. C23AA]NII10470.1 type 1 glutamine amidotransferase [Oleiagrimonas sp. C23AA]
MSRTIENKKVAIVATHGFEQSELEQPLKALREAGAQVHVVSPESGKIQGFEHTEKGREVGVDKAVADVSADDYDALVIPGGLFNPDQLRHNDQVLSFAKGFFKAGKPVGAICHGPWVLINAELVQGRKMTSVGSIQKDLANAGADWVDQEVVVDKGLVTSRTPKDLPAFCSKLIEEIAEGKHAGQKRSAA